MEFCLLRHALIAMMGEIDGLNIVLPRREYPKAMYRTREKTTLIKKKERSLSFYPLDTLIGLYSVFGNDSVYRYATKDLSVW